MSREFNSLWLAEREARMRQPQAAPDNVQGVDLEVHELHCPILEWCRNQVPEVPVIYARPFVRSTLRPGTHDFTIFYGQQVFCIECKRRTGKLDTGQQIWSHLMEQQGFVVHVIRSFQQFLELLSRVETPTAWCRKCGEPIRNLAYNGLCGLCNDDRKNA